MLSQVARQLIDRHAVDPGAPWFARTRDRALRRFCRSQVISMSRSLPAGVSVRYAAMTLSELPTGCEYTSGRCGAFSLSCFSGCNRAIRHTCYFPRPFTHTIRLGTVRAFVGARPPGILLPLSGSPACFRRLLCPLLTSATGSSPLAVRSARCRTTRQISRGEHASLRTRAPSIPIWPIMDRGLYLVLQACPTKPA